MRTASRDGGRRLAAPPRVGRDAARRVGRPDRRRHRHLDHVPLLQEFQLVEEVARSAVLLVGDHPVQLDRPSTATLRISSARDLRLGAEGHVLGDVDLVPAVLRLAGRLAPRLGQEELMIQQGRPGRGHPDQEDADLAVVLLAEPAVVLPRHRLHALNPAQPLGCTVNQVDAEPQDEEAEEQAEMRAA